MLSNAADEITSPPRVKLCGIRTYEDAVVALDAGAWALGFIFHRPSRRFIEPYDAAAIVARLPRTARTIGVFVDEPLGDLQATLREVGLSGAQLHGDESPEYAGRVEAELVLKAFRVGGDFRPELVDAFPGCTILLDAFDPLRPGGTGRTFDWNVARAVGERAPCVLAGGLTPDNVGEAIRAARPSGVDVSGGVESAYGVKDHDAIRRFLRAVSEARR